MTQAELAAFFTTDLAQADPTISSSLAGELGRQRDEI